MKALLCISAVAMIAAAPAFAQATGKPVSRADVINNLNSRFNAIDTNHDGKLTRDEVAAGQQRDLAKAKAEVAQKWREQFAKLDTNKDGKLSLDEFMAGVPGIRAQETPDQMIQRYDTNHDGKISADEFRAPQLATFQKADLNHDGVVTPDEFNRSRGGK